MLRKEKCDLKLTSRSCKAVYENFALFDSGKKGALVASESINCDCRDGVIKGGLGCVEWVRENHTTWNLPTFFPDTDGFFVYKHKNVDGNYVDGFGYTLRNGTVCLYDEQKGAMQAKKSDYYGRLKPVLTVDSDGVERIAFVGNWGVHFYNEDEGFSDSAIIRATHFGCWAKDRLFCAVNEHTIAYSAPLEHRNFVENVDDSGRITLPSDKGKIVALVTLKDEVYVFFEYGISKLVPAGSARDFKVRRLGYNGGLIFEDSVGACGEKIFFLTLGGLCVLENDVSKKTCENLPILPKERGQVCYHGVGDGYYCLSYVQENGENKCVTVHGESEEGYFSFVPKGLCSLRGKSCFSWNSGLYIMRENSALPTGEVRKFTAKNIRFGVDDVKTLKSLRVFGEGRITVQVATGRRVKEMELSLVGGFADMRVCMRAKAFSLSITLETGACVRAIQADMTLLNGRSNGRSFGAVGLKNGKNS